MRFLTRAAQGELGPGLEAHNHTVPRVEGLGDVNSAFPHLDRAEVMLAALVAASVASKVSGSGGVDRVGGRWPESDDGAQAGVGVSPRSPIAGVVPCQSLGDCAALGVGAWEARVVSGGAPNGDLVGAALPPIRELVAHRLVERVGGGAPAHDAACVLPDVSEGKDPEPIGAEPDTGACFSEVSQEVEASLLCADENKIAVPSGS